MQQIQLGFIAKLHNKVRYYTEGHDLCSYKDQTAVVRNANPISHTRGVITVQFAAVSQLPCLVGCVKPLTSLLHTNMYIKRIYSIFSLSRFFIPFLCMIFNISW